MRDWLHDTGTSPEYHLNKRLGGDLGTDLDAEYRRQARHGTQGGHCRQVVGWATQMEQGWRGRYAGKKGFAGKIG